MFLKHLAKAAACAVFAIIFAIGVDGQTKRPQKAPPKAAKMAGTKVTQVDIEGLRSLIKPNGKPLLINFWATWCDPCREEFPDLVKLSAAYKDKVDFVTVSLDDLADIGTAVPKFLAGVKSTMPAYLLKTPDESAAILLVAKDWSGNLPMTAIFASSGETVYVRMGKFRYETLIEELDRLLATSAVSTGK